MEYGDFRCRNLKNGIKITKYTGCATNVEIPKYINDSRVYSIGKYAFLDSILETITIPNSVTEICEGAFYGCRSLISIKIPNSVDYIAKSAFSYCVALINVKMLTSVSYIGDGAFIGCTSLASIKIPKSVNYIGEQVFEGCSSLSNILFPRANSYLYALRAFLKEYADKIEYYNAPNTMSEEELLAIQKNEDSQTMSINSSDNMTLTYLDFQYRKGMSGIEIAKYTGIESHIKIPEYINSVPVTSIGKYAFYYCDSLTTIEIPKSVEEINSYAFSYCNFLKKIRIPRNNKSLPFLQNFLKEYADKIEFADDSTSSFQKTVNPKINTTKTNTSNIKDFEYKKVGSGIEITKYKGCDSSVEIPQYIDGLPVVQIGFRAFNDCRSLKSIAIPDSLTKIGLWAFADCCSLTDIEIPNSVIEIDSQAFWGCVLLNNVTIPNSVREIGDEVFLNCSSLKKINFSSSNKNLHLLQNFLKEYADKICYRQYYHSSIENLVALLNRLSKVLKVNLNFNLNMNNEINDENIDLVNKVSTQIMNKKNTTKHHSRKRKIEKLKIK